MCSWHFGICPSVIWTTVFYPIWKAVILTCLYSCSCSFRALPIFHRPSGVLVQTLFQGFDFVGSTERRSCISVQKKRFSKKLTSANFHQIADYMFNFGAFFSALHNALYTSWAIPADVVFLFFLRCRPFQVFGAQIPNGMFLPDTTRAPPVHFAWMPALYSQTKSHQRSEQVFTWILGNNKNKRVYKSLQYIFNTVICY